MGGLPKGRIIGMCNMVLVTNQKSHPKLARVISSKTVFQGRVFSVTADEVEEPGGVRVRRDIVRHPGSIVVIALKDASSARRPLLLLERQYRYAADARLWELPAGRINPGEDHLTAAKRELLEETGFTASKWRRALKFYPSPGFVDEVMYVFLAQGLKRGKACPEDDERIAVRFFPLSQVIKMAMSGKIIDSKTLASLLWLEIRGKRANL
jgi:ADP-ribose pyrophosphatase